MHRSLRNVVPAFAALAVVLAIGCVDREAPTGLAHAAPEAASFNHTTGSPDISKLATFNARRSITIAWAKKWIGPEGGRLEFQGFAVDVPAGAVDKVTQFSITLPVDPNASERVLATFGPHGAKFAKPVRIEFPYAGTSLQGKAGATVGWWSNGWVDMGGTVTSDGARIGTTTTHFSDYGTMDRGGSISTSGG